MSANMRRVWSSQDVPGERFFGPGFEDIPHRVPDVGAIRRLVQGVVPSFTSRALLDRIPPRVIPWQYVDLIETDPARRVKLKIEHDLLKKAIVFTSERRAKSSRTSKADKGSTP